MPNILFTGGGSAGHVTPNLALIDKCQREAWHVSYIGSRNGIEKEIISRLHIPYYSIATGKLRRYFSWRTLIEPFAILCGIVQAFMLCRKLKPAVVFSKGGFVAFPVVFAAWLNRIPVIAHESDLTPGLANRLSFPFVTKICVTFSEGARYFGKTNKVIVTGTPVRAALLNGNASEGLRFCGFNENKPVLLIYGGGLGAVRINQVVRAALPELLRDFQIVHLCGKGKMDPQYGNRAGYRQYEYLNEELADVLACADFVISRAGANSIYELLALKKPHILIPLSAKASRGDQVVNAEYFARQGLSVVLDENALTAESLIAALKQLNQSKEETVQRLSKFEMMDSVEVIYKEIQEFS